MSFDRDYLDIICVYSVITYQLISLSHYAGHRERLRTRFMKTGVEELDVYELGEPILTLVIPPQDVKEPAKPLIQQFGNPKGLLFHGKGWLATKGVRGPAMVGGCVFARPGQGRADGSVPWVLWQCITQKTKSPG